MRRLLLPLLGLAVLAPTADAAVTYKDVSYAVTYEGQGTYEKLDQSDMGTDYWTEEETNLQFTFTGDINDGVVFRNGHPFDTSGDGLGDSSVTGSTAYRGAGGDGLTCPADSEGSWATGWTRLMEAPELDRPLDAETHLWLRPFERFDITFDCGGSFPSVGLVASDGVGEDGEYIPGEHTFDTPFALPPEVFGMGYIEQIIPPQVLTAEKCPGHLYETVECKLEWSGKVTFRKLWEKTVTSDGTYQPPSLPPGQEHLELVPLVQPDPPKPKAPPKPPAADDDLELVPLVQKGSATVDASGKVATVTVTCGGGCAGTASVIAGGRGARAAAAKPLARAKFRVPAGKKKARVRIKLGAAARMRLRRARSAKLRLAFTKPTRRTQTLALKLRR